MAKLITRMKQTASHISPVLKEWPDLSGPSHDEGLDKHHTGCLHIPCEEPIRLQNGDTYTLYMTSREICSDAFGQKVSFPIYNSLGRGVYGQVFDVVRGGTHFAAKIIKMPKYAYTGITGDVVREIALYKELSCQYTAGLFANLPKILGVKGVHVFSQDFSDRYLNHCQHCAIIIMEKCQESLKSYILRNACKLSLPCIRFFLWQFLNGVAKMHSHDMLHRDLKPENLLISHLLDNEEHYNDSVPFWVKIVKVSDLGMGRKLRHFFSLDVAGSNAAVKLGESKIVDLPRRHVLDEMTQSGMVITPPYRPPELLIADPNRINCSGSQVSLYGKACDMWSVGVIFGELCLQSNEKNSNGWKYFFYPRTREASYNGKSTMLFVNIFKMLGKPSPAECMQFKRFGHKEWNKVEPLLCSFQQLSSADRLHSLSDSIVSRNGIQLDVDGLDLLSRLLHYDPTKRLTAKDALCHPFFRGMPYKKMTICSIPSYLDRFASSSIRNKIKTLTQTAIEKYRSQNDNKIDTSLGYHLLQMSTKSSSNSNAERILTRKRLRSSHGVLQATENLMRENLQTELNVVSDVKNKELDTSIECPQKASKLLCREKSVSAGPQLASSSKSLDLHITESQGEKSCQSNSARDRRTLQPLVQPLKTANTFST